MSGLLFDNIGTLITNDPQVGDDPLGLLRDAALVVEAGVVVWAGPKSAIPQGAATDRVDVDGATVLPGFVDSHAHLVFAGDRTEEFAARMAGRPYAAGGIATTVAATRAASIEALRRTTGRLVAEAVRSGTTTIECKSGYGLTVTDEVRCLEVAAEHTEEVTFLGAHVVPPEYAGRPNDYVDLVATTMLEECAGRAKWIDVFCERGAFDGDQTREILRAGVAHGLQPRLHANQLGPGPGVQIAVEFDAASADHLTHCSDDDVAALAASRTVATLLPGAEFCCRAVYPDARRLLDAGVTVALAADCNPGSSYTTNMPFCIAVAVRDMRMTADEAVWAATAGGARALRRTDIGHLGPGARADVVVLDAPSHVHLAYRPGVPLVAGVWRAGAHLAPTSPHATVVQTVLPPGRDDGAMRTVADTNSMPGLADLIAERHRLGLDGHDEMWDGVYHVAPMARAGHGDVQGQLQVVLAALAPSDLVVSGPVNIGLGEQDHRVPDLVVLRARTNVVWVPTAAMVVEVRSPGDETYEKFGFYHARGVEEILVADMTERVLRLFVRSTQAASRAYDQVDTSVVLGVDVARIAERLVWPE